MAWKLSRSRHLLTASPAYLHRHGTPATLSDLDDHRGLFYTNRGIADWRFQTPTGAIVVRAKLAMGINNGDMLRDGRLQVSGSRCCRPSLQVRQSAMASSSRLMSATGPKRSPSTWHIRKAATLPPNSAP
ncbi:hypothetical protein AJ87_03895 [Rhizobium yanglingense]|nr:hypothetical protein AJ87_03895 [Rhizobium yanglingense]